MVPCSPDYQIKTNWVVLDTPRHVGVFPFGLVCSGFCGELNKEEEIESCEQAAETEL